MIATEHQFDGITKRSKFQYPNRRAGNQTHFLQSLGIGASAAKALNLGFLTNFQGIKGYPTRSYCWERNWLRIRHKVRFKRICSSLVEHLDQNAFSDSAIQNQAAAKDQTDERVTRFENSNFGFFAQTAFP